MLAGRPDLVTVDGNSVRVFDCKTGQQRASDVVQVQIYLHCLKATIPLYQSRAVEGVLVYRDHVVGVPGYTVDSAFVENLHHFLDVLDTDLPPLKMPSYSECRFCDIAKEACPERVEVEMESAG